MEPGTAPGSLEASAQRPGSWQLRAPPPLNLEGLASFEERDYDTPRGDGAPGPMPSTSLPTSPSQRKTKSRAAHAFYRSGSFASRNSLKDSKVLMVTGMRRSDSLQQPDLFRYHDHFEFLALLGRTHLSEVFRVRHRQTGELFAVKRSRRRFKSKLHRERCLREISAVAALPEHPNIVGQYRAWQEGGHFYIQMDLCEGGSLHQLVAAAAMQGSLLSDEELWTVLWEVASGLEFLHAHGVLHLDIKPENIYRDESGACKIGDFGLAVATETKEWWEEGDGDYVAPELLCSRGAPSPAADVYSLGATLYECATGVKLMRALPADASPAEAGLPGRPPALEALMRWMLQPDPARRPSAAQVLQYIQAQGVALLLCSEGAEGQAAAYDNGTAAEEVLPEAGSAANTPTPVASPSVATLFGGVALLQSSPFAMALHGEEGQAESQEDRFPCPFVELSQESSGEEMVPAAAQPGPQNQQAAAAAGQEPFSFAPLPPPACAQSLRPPGWQLGITAAAAAAAAANGSGDGAVTPLARPPRKGSVGGRLSTAVARRAAAAVSGLQRWVPSLSPLVSEGALTPGALARLSPLSAIKTGREPAELRSRGSTPGSGTPVDDGCSPMLSPDGGRSSGGAGSGAAQRGRRSVESRGEGGWRLSRRDMISPDSDALARSVTESDLYSFSCGTGGSVSSLEFMDTCCPSRPTSPEFQSAAPRAEAQATPELFQRAQHLPAGPAAAGPAAPPARVLVPAPSLGWDLHTSPEFLMQLPPGSPASPSAATQDSQLPARSFSSIRRFPTLDSMESMQLEPPAGQAAVPGGGGGGGKPGRISSFSSIPQRLTASFGQPMSDAGAQAVAAADPAAQARKRPLSRHNSRRGLLAVLSREGSLASCGSLDQLQLAKMRREGEEGGLGSAGEEAGQQEAAPALPYLAAAPWGRGMRAVGSSSRLQQAGPAPQLQLQQQPAQLRQGT